MIVRAGGISLSAPDTMPAAAVEPLRFLRQQARYDQGAPTFDELAALEVAAFGECGASRLRRRGVPARIEAAQTLIRRWTTCP